MENKPEATKRMYANQKYVIGLGKTLVEVAKNTDTEIPIILISKITDQKIVGENLLGVEVEQSEITAIFIKNLEGLKVLEKAVKCAKKILKEQNKILKK